MSYVAGLSEEERARVERFRAFLQIPTVSHTGPAGAYRRAVDYLRGLLAEHFELAEHEPVPGKPVLVATWRGTDDSLPSVLLNSHYDVVPAEPAKWSCDPFGAVLADEGRTLYGRGTQDMKSVGMQYVEALTALKRQGRRLLRTVHLLFVPDEEIGGSDGMARFVETESFRRLRVGVALDEGLANPDPAGRKFTVFYSERAVWWLMIRAEGPTGHGSRFVEGTAMERLIKCVQKFLDYRETQRRRLHEHGPGCEHAVALKLGDVATVNLTALRGGVSSDGGKSFALNVVPTSAEAGFDIRVPPSIPLEEMEARVREWTGEFGLTYTFVYRTPVHAVSSTDRKDCRFYGALEDALAALGAEVELEVFPAGTDGRYVRTSGDGVNVYGFSPMSNTPILLHDHDERIATPTYLRGVTMYERIITDLASVPPS